MGANTPSGPRGLPLVGNTHQWVRGPLEFRERCAREYGRVVRYEILGTETYMLTEPADVKRVLTKTGDEFQKHQGTREVVRPVLGSGLVNSEGELWRQQREAIQPVFYMDSIKRYGEVMVRRTLDACERWADGETVPISPEMQRVTLEILVEAMFGPEFDLAERGIYEAVTDLLAPFEPRNQPIAFLTPDWLPVPLYRRYEAAIDHLESVIYEMVQRRRSSADDRDDLLSILLSTDTAMDDEQIRDEMMTFLLAGHETTAMTLTFALHLLTDHPDVATRLREEVAAVVDGRPAAADVFAFETVERVVKEALRLYPPAHDLRRSPVADVTFGEYRVPSGSLVLIPTWVLHRDERFWTDPEAFRPARWADEGAATDGDAGESGTASRSDRPKFAYVPFGGGPRACIGQQFAMMEAQLVLATLLDEWTFEREYQDLPLSAGPSLKPKHDVEMTVRRR